MSAVAQLHVLGTIILSKNTPVLMLRLAYTGFVRVTETLKDEAAADRLAGKVTYPGSVAVATRALRSTIISILKV